jgi:transcriptional regulator with XRE-family HTH domain
MKKKSDSLSKRAGSLGWVAEEYFTKGPQAAEAALASIVPEVMLRPYSVLKAGEGQACLRTDAEAQDQIVYHNFNPPPLWEAPYALYHVRFSPLPKQDFMFHSGEEMLIPIAGEITYHFYWSPGMAPPKREVLDPPLRPYSVIRINPQVPHHTWATGKTDADAWMVFRHGSDSPAAIGLKAGLHSDRKSAHPTPRRISLEKLQSDPGKYALVAWGLAEKIRLYRQRAGLTIGQLATECGINPSYLSRIEDADTNVSLDLLARIARVVHMSLDFLEAGSWSREVQAFPKPKWKEADATGQPLLHKPRGCPHFLHLNYWGLAAKGEAKPPTEPFNDEGSMSSWIVMDGRVIFEIPAPSDGGPWPQWSELLEAGSVIHFRRLTPIIIHGLDNSQLLQVVYSSNCPCLPWRA